MGGLPQLGFLKSFCKICFRLLRFPPREAVAALIMSSQKTMPFAVSIVALLPASFGSKGLLTLPPLVSQMCQLFCDIWIARYWGKKVGPSPLLYLLNEACVRARNPIIMLMRSAS